MTKSSPIRPRAVLLVSILLAAALPALAQDTNAGQIWAYYPDWGKTHDVYIVNYTRSPISIATNDWSLPLPSNSVPAWGTIAMPGLDTSKGYNGGFVTFSIGSSHVTITNSTEKHVDDVFWTLTGDFSFTTGDLPATVDPASGACAFTDDFSTAMYSDKYSVLLANEGWDDADKGSGNWKMVLLFTEIVKDASGKVVQSYQNCMDFNGQNQDNFLSRAGRGSRRTATAASGAPRTGLTAPAAPGTRGEAR